MVTRYEEDEAGLEIEGRERIETINTLYGSRNQLPFGGAEGGSDAVEGTWRSIGEGVVSAEPDTVARGDYSISVYAQAGETFRTLHIKKISVKQNSLVFLSSYLKAEEYVTESRMIAYGVQTGRTGDKIVEYQGTDYGGNYDWQPKKYLFRVKDTPVDYLMVGFLVTASSDNGGHLYVDEVNAHVLRGLNEELQAPIHESYSGSIPAGGSDTVSVTVPDGEIWRINTTNQTDSGADISLDWIKAGGVKISTSHLTNREVLLFQGESLTAQYSNGGTASETAYLKIHGRGFR